MGLGKSSPDTSNYYSGLWDKSPGIASVGSYQASGHPYVSGSNAPVAAATTVSFRLPNVSKSITLLPLLAPTDSFSLHFAPAAAGPTVAADHGIPFPSISQPAITIDVKCVDVYVTNPAVGPSTAGFKFYASLTGIGPAQMFTLTGSGVTD
jgi:hypothetical protein